MSTENSGQSYCCFQGRIGKIKTTIVSPAYNNVERHKARPEKYLFDIDEVLDDLVLLRSHIPQVFDKVYVVNDGSDDSTRDVISAYEKKHSFIEVKTIENIQRNMVISEQGTRPSFKMLGHTGYLTFARKVL